MSASHFSRLLLFVATVGLSAFASAHASPKSRVEIPDAAQPQLVADSQGGVWLVYGHVAGAAPVALNKEETASAHKPGGQHQAGGHVHGGPRPEGEIFVARSLDGGATFAPAIRVAGVPTLMLGNRRGPRIAVHGDRITITVIGNELLAFTSTDAGRSWSGPVTINEVPTSAREGLHDLAGSRAGELFVTWLDLRNGKMELWGADSRDGGRTWGSNRQVYKSPDKSICECCHPSALYDTDGNLAVMWRNSLDGARDMWMATRPKGAGSFTAARKLGEGTWKLNACPMDGGRIVVLGGGKFGAVWQRNGDVFISRAEGAEVSLGKGRQPVAVHSANGPPMVIWQQGLELVAFGNPHDAKPVTCASDGRFPAVVALPGGQGVLLAYEHGAKGATSVAVERL